MPSSCRVWTTVMPFSPDHQDTLLTSCSVYWTLQHVSSLAHVSSTTACHTCCMQYCTGSTSQNISTIQYKLGVTVHHCLQYKAPEYLVNFCTPVSDIPSRHHLRSATRHHLTIPCYQLSTFGRRAFSVAGLTIWNSLPDSLCDPAITATVSDNCWKRVCLVVTTQHTQHSRDASLLCAI